MLNTDARFYPLIKELLSKFNAVILIIGVIFLVDLFTGYPLITKLIHLQFKLMGEDPTKGGFTFISFWGTYTSIKDMARVLDRGGAVIFLVIAGWFYLRGLKDSLKRRY